MTGAVRDDGVDDRSIKADRTYFVNSELAPNVLESDIYLRKIA